MTKQELYNYFRKKAKYYTLRKDAEIYAEAAAAVFKQIPKEPLSLGNKHFVCATCRRRLKSPIEPHTGLSGKRVSRLGDHFCPRCGQAIMWEGITNDKWTCGARMDGGDE